MKLYSFCFPTLLVLFFLCLLYKPSNCQQTYLNNYQLDCDANPSATRGNYCSGPKKSCQSFTTFRSAEPYNTPISIAYLLGSEASSIASINNISSTDKIPSQKTVIVPISCSCSGSIYQQNAPYTIKKTSETYFTIANDTYQGLTTCQALMDQNKYKDTNLSVGLQLMIPLRCACPSESQAANGVTALLNYMITWGDTISHIANSFGVQEQSILDANMLPPDSLIFPFTPLQIPLKGDSCGAGLFTIRNGSLEFGNCQSESKKLPVKLVTLLGIGLGLGFLCLFLVGCQFYRYFQKRRDRARKEKLFKQNGGYLLEQRLSFYGTNERAKIFTAEELESATDNYSQSRFLGQGGFGTVYKGMLKDGSIVAVKRSKAIDKGQIEQFINEVVILSQINHRHVVKLLGCCLETEVPVLVYEFISNGTLSKHIHQLDQENESSSLSWEHRVRIACEVAGAVAYMHSAASIPIIHRDIKSSNILLDDKFSAKVSDFGTSRSIPNDKTHLTTQVQGTFGYLDPEYFQSSQFTDKSDVYSFGVVLVELLTGKKPISLARAEEEINLVAYFISSAKENKQPEIIDPTLTKDAEKEDIDAVAELALRCLRLKGKKRPTMKQVSLELEGLRRSQRCLDIYEEPHVLRDETSNLQNAEETGQESIADNSTFALQMESESF